MRPSWLRVGISFFAALLASAAAFGRPAAQLPQVSEPEVEVDAVGDVDGSSPVPQKTLQDTIWIADWTFDTAAPCSPCIFWMTIVLQKVLPML